MTPCKALAALLFAAATFGCTVETKTLSSSGTDSGGLSVGKTEPAASKDVVVEQPKIDTTQKVQVDNPDRVYQLRDLQKVKLTANGHTIDAWVMDTNGKRMEGMMFLKPQEIKESQGMIFVFANERDKSQSFWMKDTYTPLDILYIGKDKKVVNVGKGQPLNENPVYPAGSYQYVLELKQGVSKKLGIKPGTSIGIPGTLKAEE